jgi:hypothetical protein
MDAVTIAAVVPAITSAGVAIARVWLRAGGERQRVRERSRHDYACSLPSGSRIIDLGKNGLVIEIGPRPARNRPARPGPALAKERSRVGR